MKRTALCLLLFCGFIFSAHAQKKGKDVPSDLSNIEIDTVALMREYAKNACDCMEKMEKLTLDRKPMHDSIARCIDEQASSYQTSMALFSALKNSDSKKKEINIYVNNDKTSDEYRLYYRRLETWLKDSCRALNIMIASNDVASDKSYTENEDARKKYNEGITLLNNEEYQKALPLFKEAVTIDPSFVFAWDNLGICYRKTGKYPEAAEAYKRSLSIDPEGRLPLMNLPNVYRLMNQPDSAIAAYEHILHYYPEDAESYYGVGITLLHSMNDAEKALPYLCKAYNIYVKEKSPYRSDAEKLINEVYADMKKNKKEELFMKILKDHGITPR